MTWVPERVALFWAFARERHRMYLRRHVLREPPPWTADYHLARGYYTNVYRELDRGTRYLLEQIVPRWRLDPASGAFATVVYRMFNLEATFTALAGAGLLDTPACWRPRVARGVLLGVQQQHGTFTSGAYIVSPCGERGAKVDLLANRLAAVAGAWPEFSRRLLAAPSLGQAHARLTELPGVAGFIGYEIVTDLCYGGWVLPFSPDDWVFIGPGARRGLALLCKDRIGGQAAHATLVAQLRDDQGGAVEGPRLTLRDVEHTLCEFQKYWRFRETGRIKRRYNGSRGDLVPPAGWAATDHVAGRQHMREGEQWVLKTCAS